MKILLFGSRGQLGAYLTPVLGTLGEIAAYDRQECDLMDLAAVRRVILQERPNIVVNASGYTAVDQAEADVVVAQRVNAEAPAVMAETARELGALLVHYSTDYVFDGAARAPYAEEAEPAPMGIYGETKLAGEQAIAASGVHYLILRTAWLYSNHGKNFFKTMLKLTDEHNELRVMHDQTGNPTYAKLVAANTANMLAQMFDHGQLVEDRCGLYHMACQGSTTWYELAKNIMQLAGKADSVRVIPIVTADYPTPARRPAYSSLSTKKLARVFDLRLPAWQTGLEQCFAEHVSSG